MLSACSYSGMDVYVVLKLITLSSWDSGNWLCLVSAVPCCTRTPVAGARRVDWLSDRDDTRVSRSNNQSSETRAGNATWACPKKYLFGEKDRLAVHEQYRILYIHLGGKLVKPKVNPFRDSYSRQCRCVIIPEPGSLIKLREAKAR